MSEIKARSYELQGALKGIEAAEDAARLRLHWLSMQASEGAEEFDPSFESLEQRLDRGIEHAMRMAMAARDEPGPLGVANVAG